MVQRVAMGCFERGGRLLDALLEDDEIGEHLSPAELRACFDPARALRRVPEILERVGVPVAPERGG